MDIQSTDSTLFLWVVRHIWQHAQSFPESLTQDDVEFVQSLLSHMVSFSTGCEWEILQFIALLCLYIFVHSWLARSGGLLSLLHIFLFRFCSLHTDGRTRYSSVRACYIYIYIQHCLPHKNLKKWAVSGF